MSSTAFMKVEVDSETCAICSSNSDSLLTPEEYDAGVVDVQTPFRAMLLQINNNKVIPEGRFCTNCIRRTVDAYEFSSVLSSKTAPPLSEKIRTLRKRLLELTEKIDVFIVVGGQNKVYNEEDILMVERDALAKATELDNEEIERARNAAGVSVYQCTVCPMSFQTTSAYRNHLSTHGESARHCCWTCGAQFLSIEALRDHEILHQVNDRSLKNLSRGTPVCPLCSESFSTRAEVARHARVAHPGPDVVCPVCLTVMTAEQLPAHQLSHRQADRFVCSHDLCILRFPTRNDLMTHIRTCHAGASTKVEEQNEPQAPTRSEVEKAFVSDKVPCPNCDRSFGSVAAMKRHARVHRRDIPQDEEWLAPDVEELPPAEDVEYLELETLDEMHDD
ncbi:unnamed protein product [Leptosia nina]|uniref:C2H2-type domain-containing protein n=1 Tax=Leptosia nina TaxID=320188 RepID=A0AAV1JVK1_9NEOP